MIIAPLKKRFGPSEEGAQPAKYVIKLINATDAKTLTFVRDGESLSNEDKTLMVPTKAVLQVLQVEA